MSRKIGIFQVVLLTISAIVSLRSLPIFAEMGLSIVFFLVIAFLVFFIPIAMVISELSSTWPDEGGCYLWIKKAYGKTWAFFVLWAYWMESIMWFPTALMFAVAMLAHILSPFYFDLEHSNVFLVFGMIVIFWILTVMNFYGVKFSAAFSSFGVLVGTIFPLVLIIILGIVWLVFNGTSNISFTFSALIPSFDLSNFVFFSVILLGVSGIELISFHIKDIENPSVNIVKALIISSFFILFIYIMGSLSIAIIVPKSDICLASGVIQALKIFFNNINIPFVVPVIAFLLFLGSISCVNVWIIGPPRGLLIAAKDGILPDFFKYVNRNNVPVVLLIVQAVVGSLVSIVFFLYINSINGLIWIFVCLSFQFAAFLYVMIFLSVLKLRKLFPVINRPYKVLYIKLISYVGIAACFFAFFISYIQPAQINITDKTFYFFLLFFSFIVLMLPSFCFVYFYRKRKY